MNTAATLAAMSDSTSPLKHNDWQTPTNNQFTHAGSECVNVFETRHRLPQQASSQKSFAQDTVCQRMHVQPLHAWAQRLEDGTLHSRHGLEDKLQIGRAQV